MLRLQWVEGQKLDVMSSFCLQAERKCIYFHMLPTVRHLYHFLDCMQWFWTLNFKVIIDISTRNNSQINTESVETTPLCSISKLASITQTISHKSWASLLKLQKMAICGVNTLVESRYKACRESAMNVNGSGQISLCWNICQSISPRHAGNIWYIVELRGNKCFLVGGYIWTQMGSETKNNSIWEPISNLWDMLAGAVTRYPCAPSQIKHG